MSADQETEFRAKARALERRYPGVSVKIFWLDHAEFCKAEEPAYKGWRIRFEAADADTLVRYRLATAEEFERGACVQRDEFGHGRSAHGIIDSGRQFGVGIHIPDFEPDDHLRPSPYTKAMQAKVARLLRRAFTLPPRRSQAAS